MSPRFASDPRGIDMPTYEQIERAAMTLPPDDREKLGHAMLASLPVDPEAERALESTIARRWEEIQSGRVKPISAEDVFARIDALLEERDREE